MSSILSTIAGAIAKLHHINTPETLKDSTLMGIFHSATGPFAEGGLFFTSQPPEIDVADILNKCELRERKRRTKVIAYCIARARDDLSSTKKSEEEQLNCLIEKTTLLLFNNDPNIIPYTCAITEKQIQNLIIINTQSKAFEVEESVIREKIREGDKPVWWPKNKAFSEETIDEIKNKCCITKVSQKRIDHCLKKCRQDVVAFINSAENDHSADFKVDG